MEPRKKWDWAKNIKKVQPKLSEEQLLYLAAYIESEIKVEPNYQELKAKASLNNVTLLKKNIPAIEEALAKLPKKFDILHLSFKEKEEKGQYYLNIQPGYLDTEASRV